jgi:glycosyltransferase involved in cell wall biosynthesis
MNPMISAIVCTHNRAAYLNKALQSLVDQSLRQDRYEILVVDNCSMDSTKDVIAEFSSVKNLHYCHEAQLGLSYARNTGWRAAKGRYVAYLDDDAIACPTWLETIVDVFETVTPRPGCIGGKTSPIWEAPRPTWLSDELVSGLTVIDWSETPQTLPDLTRQWLVGANLAFPVDILQEVGGFTSGLDRRGSRLLSSGDIFLEKQILKAGYSCFYHPLIAVEHHIPRTRLEKSWFMRRYYWQGISDATMQLIEENPSPVRRLRIAASKALTLGRSPRKLMSLVSFTQEPKGFTERCFTLIALGQIMGLLGVAQRPK